MALNLGYRSATIRKYRYILQDYFEENGFNLTDKVRVLLAKVVLNIKKTHSIKNQNLGKPPCMYEDLKNMLKCIPRDFERKNLMRSLFLCAFYTAQRSNSCVSVRFEDLIFGKNAKGKPFATITFNVVKGISLNADIRRTILANSNDPEMCFIKAIEDYLESEYEIRIDEYNGIRNQENYSKKKVWNQTRHTFRSNVYTASENSGYGYWN